MKSIKRKFFSTKEKEFLWDRWRKGDSIAEIARALSRHNFSVRYILVSHGGISPSKRKRAQRSLSLSERETISRSLCVGQLRSIAKALGRSPSTISREVKRNGGTTAYRAHKADAASDKRARRPKICKLDKNLKLCQQVAQKLKLSWSPEQIACWFKLTYPEQPEMYVSHETIYCSLYIQARGALKKELMQHLRQRRKLRRAKCSKQEKRGEIPDLLSISERPPEVEDRAVPGHWEGDLIAGSKNSYIATLVERHTRYVMLVKVADKRTDTVISALKKHAKKLPE